MIGSNRTSNEENYLLQKFARLVLGTNNIDHHRTADFPAFASALAGKTNATASMRDVFNRACDPADRQQSHRAASPAGLADSHATSACIAPSFTWRIPIR